MLVPWGGVYETGREADAVSISALAVLMLGVFSIGRSRVFPMASRMYILQRIPWNEERSCIRQQPLCRNPGISNWSDFLTLE